MFDYIKGTLADKNYPYCTIENNGVGYQILVNSRTLKTLGEIDSKIKIYTKLIHKEDSMTLCGFKNKQDRIIFDILTSVSGIGVKVAFALFDEFDTKELIEIVMDENVKMISKAKGVGAKMAQKIVFEIKDKLTKIDPLQNSAAADVKSTKISPESIKNASAVLQSLGYTSNEYNKALQTAASVLDKDDPSELLKEALKILSLF